MTTNTYTPARANIAQMILSSALAPYLSNPGAVERYEFGALYARFSREYTDTEVTCNLDIDFIDNYRDTSKDDEGNEYVGCKVRVCLSWAAYGSLPLDAAERHLQFYQEVLSLGQRIKAKYEGIVLWQITRTADEIAAEEAMNARKQIQADLGVIVDKVRKNMRVGTVRSVDDVTIATIAVGSYEYEDTRGNRFQVVRSGVGNTVKRIA